MITRFLELALPLVILILLSACTQQQFYWGSYEDSLYYRYQHPGEPGETQSLSMLADTISEAEQSQAKKVAPGIYADYGYVLFKQGKPDEAVAAWRKEAELFPESKHLMDTMISRIQNKNQNPADERPTP